MPHDDRRRRFELLALPHLDAAYNLARWLVRNTTDAEDVVQDAYLRSYRYFDAFQGGNFRVWLLTIVRNAFMTWVKENRSGRMMFVPDTPAADNADTEETMWGSRPRDPESLLLESIDSPRPSGQGTARRGLWQPGERIGNLPQRRPAATSDRWTWWA